MVRRRSQRGLSQSVQAALVLPAFFTLMLVALQWAMHSWASSTAMAAAEEGARAASSYTATMDDGLQAARKLVNADALRDATATGSRSSTEVTVTVTGHAMSLMPGWAPTITKTVVRPVERLTGPR